MSKDSKTKMCKKRFTPTVARTTTTKTEQRQKSKKIVIKVNPEDAISKSQQLSSKLQTNTEKNKTFKKNYTRVYGSGKPMPSLSELENIFEAVDSTEKPEAKHLLSEIQEYGPETLPSVQSENLPDGFINSPHVISDVKLECVSSITDHLTVPDDNDQSQLPVVPLKKRKKPDPPYIAGCTNQPQIPSRHSIGDPDYEAEQNTLTGEDINDKKKAIQTHYSQSILKSEEIAARLNEVDDGASDVSTDSNKTVLYNVLLNDRVQHSFSPIPSTSRDSQTMLKNDMLFIQSMLKSSTNDNESDVQIVDDSLDTVIINDSTKETNSNIISKTNYSVIDLDHDDVQIINLVNNDEKSNYSQADVEIITDNPLRALSPNVSNDYYSLLNLDHTDDTPIEEVIDNLIAESNIIIKKYENASINPNNLRKPGPSNKIVNNNSYSFASSSHNKLQSTVTVKDLQDNLIPPNTVTDIRNNAAPGINRNIEKSAMSEQSHVNNQKHMINPNITNVDFNTVIEIDNDGPNVDRSNMRAEQPQSQNVHNINSTIQINDNHNKERNNMQSVPPCELNTDSVITICDNHNCQGSSNRQGLRRRKASHNLLKYPNVTNIDLDSIPGTSDGRSMGRINNIYFKVHVNIEDSPDVIEIIDDIPNENVLQDHTSSNNNNSINSERTRNRVSFIRNSNGNFSRQSFQRSAPKHSTKDLPCPLHSPSCILHPKSPENQKQKPIHLGDCPICMDSLSNNTMASTICGHVFCMRCIQAVVKSGEKKCPTCRKKFKGIGYHKIFL